MTFVPISDILSEIFGIDTVKLYTSDFRILSHQNYEKKEISSTGEITKFCFSDGLVHIEANRRGLFCRFCAPKLLGFDNNLFLAKPESMKLIENKLETYFSHLSTSVPPISQLSISRIDFAKNMLLDKPTELYIELLSKLGFNAKKSSKYPTTYELGSSRWYITFYDKREEMKRRGILAATNGKTLLRCEARILRKNMAEEYGLNTLASLYGSNNQVEKIFNRIIEKIFPPQPEGKEKRSSDYFLELLLTDIKAAKEPAFSIALHQYKREVVWNIMVAKYSPSYAQKLMRDHHKRYIEYLNFQRSNGSPLLEAYNELLDKIRCPVNNETGLEVAGKSN